MAVIHSVIHKTLLSGSLLAASAGAAATSPAGAGTGGVPSGSADAPTEAAPGTLAPVQVRASRLQSPTAFELPAAVTVRQADSARDGLAVARALSGVPGLAARDRQNQAQDTQLAIRGFGARATFGVRGVRLYADGIPATMPDGQGQLAHFDIAGDARIEVMRGPFSALHGNSSGGVVELWSPRGRAGDPWTLQLAHDRHGARSASAQASGAGRDWDYALSLSRLDSDGWRRHSAARRALANLLLGRGVGTDGRLQLVANVLELPSAQDPLGLTRAQFEADPRQAAPQAAVYDTRKSVRQAQLGLRLEHPVAGGTLLATGHGGQRAVEQFLALPASAQANPLNAGGVIDLDGRYAGLDLRWSWQGTWLSRPLEVSVGSNHERQQQVRLGWENHLVTASGERLGVRGALRRDEDNRVAHHDTYAQAWWAVAPRWSLLLGARHSRVGFASEDRYIRAGNPDDSGRVDYRQATPVAGLVFAPRADLRVYASAGRGFETPTFNELGYRADGGAGMAFDLRPAVSDNLELGLKWQPAAGTRVEAALFRADTADELGVARNVGGRSSYRNLGRARREGLELAWQQALGAHWHWQLALTQLDARFRDALLVCTGSGCTTPATPIAAGARIPGIAARSAQARLGWQRAHWQAGVELEASGDVLVNDTGTERAPGHALVHLHAARSWTLPNGELLLSTRMDNVFDHAHVGSVIVNEGNGRYYEPGPGRGLRVALRWRWQRAGG